MERQDAGDAAAAPQSRRAALTVRPVFLFSFKGELRPLPYALGALAVFLSQYAVVVGTAKLLGASLLLDGSFFIVPLRSIVVLSRGSNVVLILALAYWLIVLWMLAALAFRRAANAGIAEWLASLVIAPVLQIPVILVLCAWPPRAEISATADQAASRRSDWVAAAQGVLAGIALTLASVALGALVFGVYGFGMFVVSPLVIGATTAYIANRRADIGPARTALLVTVATALGGVGLVVAALEGAVCIVMAAPLGLLVAVLGGVVGRQLALQSRRPGHQTLSSVAVIPLVFAVEHIFPPLAAFDARETILVDAPPALVWNAIVHMDAIDEPLALPFRLGVAYPLGGEIVGEGVGAIRYGAFSTGTARERVTEWLPDRQIAFAVQDDVPAMRELSPYDHVHAPHVIGYFTTKTMSFELVPHGNARTEIVEMTSHVLRLDPVLYWLPFARYIVHANNARVLEHVRAQAEREFGAIARRRTQPG
jgi:hypothetical protein